MEIVLYAFTVMHTPGPVNLLGLNAGLMRSPRESLGFFLGVALAMFVWFVVIGFAGQLFVVQRVLPYIAFAGSAYILYLAVKVYRAPVSLDAQTAPAARLMFRDGFLMQLLNPKNSLVVIPIATVMFPGRGIAGGELLACSAAIALGGGGAPALYALAGHLIGRRIARAEVFHLCHRLMALLLVVVAILMLRDYVWYSDVWAALR